MARRTFWWQVAAAVGLAAGLATGGSATAAPRGERAAIATPHPPAAALRTLQAAETRLSRLTGLKADSLAAAEMAADIARRQVALVQGRTDTLDALAQALAAQQPVAECRNELQALREAQADLLQRWTLATTSARQQVRAVAAAQGTALAGALSLADRQAEARAEAERALSDGQLQLQSRPQECRHAAAQADLLAVQARFRQDEWVRGARELQSRTRSMHHKVDGVMVAARETAGALRLDRRPAATRWSSTDAMDTLIEALDQPGQPASAPRIDLSDLAALTEWRQAIQRRAVELARQEDAAAYLDLLIEENRHGCGEQACAPLESDRTALQLRISQAQGHLQVALQAFAKLPLSAQAPLMAPRAQLQAGQARLQALAATTAAAADQAGQQVELARSALADLDATLQHAATQAERERQQAHLAAHGRPAPELVRKHMLQGEAPAMAMASGPDHRAMAAPRLGGHAYELVTGWNAEPKNFGAYTYVLLRSTADLQRPDVVRRWLHLLERIMRERRADAAADFEKSGVNLFCIPATETPSASAPPPAEAHPLLQLYASDLGQQWLLHTNGGLLTRQTFRKMLSTSPGPFLITLPVRLAEARSTMPVLFADLSGYADDAIADLVTNYMGSLLEEFPRDQAQWKPPVRQRVALHMIHLIADASELMMSVIPSAQAEPGH